MNWAIKRRILFIALAIAIFSAIGTVIYYARFYEVPSCTDKKENQNEEGIDCGGPCAVICSDQIAPPVIFWQRAFESAHGAYNAVAYVENPNPDLGVEEAVYRFKLYDDKNIFITERIGKTFIAPNEKFAVFEARLPVGERIPKRTFFEFISFSPWTKIIGEKPRLTVLGEQISSASAFPRATAVLENKTIIPLRDIEVAAIVYDSEDNAMAVSATTVDVVSPESSFDLVFTWTKPFRVNPVRVEIIPRINPFTFSSGNR